MMETIKQEAIDALLKLPETADIDDIMYRLYVIDKVRKAKEAIMKGNTIPAADLRKEMESW